MASEEKKPRVILGLMTFGPPDTEQFGTRMTSLDTFNDCLDLLQRRGYNEVDTARTYVDGHQEAWTRDAQWQKRALKLATKWYPRQPGDHAAAIVEKQLEKSLSELGFDSVDIFYLHGPDRSVPFEETLQAVNELYQEGKFKQLGLSNYAAWEVATICTIARERKWIQPTIYQAMYNAFTRAIEEELVPCCRNFGLEIVVYNPLAGGVLSGKYRSSDAPIDGRFSDTDPVVGKMYRDRYFGDANFEALQILEPVAKEHGLTLPRVALRWCVHHSKLDVVNGSDGIIIGVSSREQLETNLDILEQGPLPQATVDALDQVWEKVTKASCPLYWR
ncbi:Putative aldo/keto reductase, aldo-keto reductase, NADP-dependent oxidoreductase [Septoria linicola]|uniref:Aldo/keto reductase, aldo-keto reductase, NADP-dependent oxidoreductase n=1 Tax=Septoria linicola TaxID=215465 RepID=A0A9Q9AZ51_9PEZI|nr:Putative aldo/keto reductase, aldo-keto reductase, NADP-dependent oxidoreductase [Septoria linicola]